MKVRTPSGFSADARQLWRDTLAKYDLETHELLTLKQACRELSLCDRMQADIDKLRSLTVDGSMGQPVISEHVKEIRQHRAEFTRLIRALGLPAEDSAAQSQARSTKAREAANARWRRTG